MTDFLLELRSEEIPARMQAKAKDDLARLFAEEIAKSGLAASAIETFATPRRLALIARDLPLETAATSEERKGPRANAPEAALAGFLRSTGLTREQLTERDGILFATIERPGRPATTVLAEAIPAIVRAFPWPKSMRWGDASLSTESPRWVRPLQGIVALLGETIVPFEIAGIESGATTLGHRFHHPGPITIGSAADYVEKLRACHVIVHFSERCAIIRDRARALAAEAGYALIEDEALVAENAGLTEWPVPLLGRFDETFLDVPPEVIRLTMRTNQKYFALKSSPLGGGGGEADGGGVSASAPSDPLRGPPPPEGEDLAPAFIATANIEATDGGTAIVTGNQRVLAARLADAKFFWENDLKVPLEEQAEKLGQIVFHEKLGTVADKVERVAKLAKWLVEEGIVREKPLPSKGGVGVGDTAETSALTHPPTPSLRREGEELATLVTRAARLCKADLVTGLVGEFPELQGIIGGHLARAQGEHPAVAAAIRDHYKPVGQGDEVPTDPVTVAVSLADKLHDLIGFFAMGIKPTGSKDPYALRRAAIGAVSLILLGNLRLPLSLLTDFVGWFFPAAAPARDFEHFFDQLSHQDPNYRVEQRDGDLVYMHGVSELARYSNTYNDEWEEAIEIVWQGYDDFLAFFVDRLKVQQREYGVRHDVIDAVFALSTGLATGHGEDDLVRLLARVRALQAFVGTADGANLLAGYKRAANILKKEDSKPLPSKGGVGVGDTRDPEDADHVDSTHPNPVRPVSGRPGDDLGRTLGREGLEKGLSYTPEPAESALIAALDAVEPAAAAAVEREDFEGAMTELSRLRAPVDAFFDGVTVNDTDPAKRTARLALLARVRDAVHRVADFSKIEG